MMPVPPVVMIDLRRRLVELLLHGRADRVGIVAHDRAAGDVMAVRLEQLRDRRCRSCRFQACGCR